MAINALVLLLVCSSFAVLALKEVCPPPEETSCVCEILWGPSITCSQLITADDLNSNFTALRGYKIDRLTVDGINVAYVPVDLYSGLHIEQIHFHRCEVKAEFGVQRNYFLGLEKTLKILDISHSFKKDSPLAHFKLDDLTLLQALLMNDNKISEMGNDWFQGGPKSLSVITLERNGIERLGDKVFQSLEGLKVLWVKGNSFSEISRSMFPSPAPYLEQIDLSSNKIRKLPTGLFSDMPLLSVVFVGHNLIHTISEETFSPDSMLAVRLYLNGNPLQCDSELKWVCRYGADLSAAKCSSPSDKRGLLLSGFCDTHTRFL